MFNLTVNSTHVANSLNNTYVYNFESGGFIVPENAQMMITSFTIPYSFYNISARYNNNVLRIYWPNGFFKILIHFVTFTFIWHFKTNVDVSLHCSSISCLYIDFRLTLALFILNLHLQALPCC